MSNNKGFLALWCIAEPETCEPSETTAAFRKKFKADLAEIDADLSYAAVHASAEAHGVIAEKREKAFAAYQKVLEHEKAGQQKKVESGIDQVLNFTTKLTGQSGTLQENTETAFKAWGDLADSYVETARRIDEMDTWGYKKAEAVLSVTGKIDAMVLQRNWAKAVSTQEALTGKLDPIYATFGIQKVAKETYEQEWPAIDNEIKIFRLAGDVSEVMDSYMVEAEDAVAEMKVAVKAQDYAKAIESMGAAGEAIEGFKEAMGDPDRKGYLDGIAAFEKRLAAAPEGPTETHVNEFEEIRAAHEEMKLLVDEGGDFGTAHKLLQETSDRLATYETNAVWDQEALLTAYNEERAAIDARLEEVSAHDERDDLSKVHDKLTQAVKDMDKEAKDECYDLALELAPMVNKQIDLFMAELEKADAKTGGAAGASTGTSTEEGTSEADSTATDNKALKSEYETIRGKIWDRLNGIEVDGERDDLKKKKAKIDSQIDAMEAKADEALYQDAIDATKQVNEELDGYIAERDKRIGEEKKRAEEILYALQTEYDSVAGVLADDKEVKEKANAIRVMLGDMRSLIATGHYKHVALNEPEASKLLGAFAPLNVYRLADKEVEENLGVLSLEANRTDKALNKHSDKIGGWAAKMDKLGEKGDYQGAIKLADQIKAEYALFEQVLSQLKSDEKELSQTIYPELKERYDAVAANLAPATDVHKFAEETDKAIQLMYAEMCRHDYEKAKKKEPEARTKLEKLEGWNAYGHMDKRVQDRLGEVSMNSQDFGEPDLKKADKAIWALVKKIDAAAAKEDYAAAIALEDGLNQAIDYYLEEHKKAEDGVKWLLEHAIPDMQGNFEKYADVPLPSQEMRDLAAKYEDKKKGIDACMRAKDYGLAQDRFSEASDLVFKLVEIATCRDRIKMLKAYETLSEKLEGSEKPDDERLQKDQEAIQAAYNAAKALADDGKFKQAGKQLAKVNKMIDAYDRKQAKLEQEATKKAA